MFVLTEQVINTAINNIGGFIVSEVAYETGKSIEEVSEAFLGSDTYNLLCDIETGYYWDSLSEIIDMLKNEM